MNIFNKLKEVINAVLDYDLYDIVRIINMINMDFNNDYDDRERDVDKDLM